MEELKSQDALYQPSSFWRKALLDINANFVKKGISSFRREDINLKFFVPTYGPPGNGFSESDKSELASKTYFKNKKQKSHFLNFFNGTSQAFADYRTFLSSCRDNKKIDLLKFSESKVGNPIEHFSFDNRLYSRSALNYLLGLSFLRTVDPKFFPKIILEIGGGFGTLGEILGKTLNYQFKYIDVDLPPLFLMAESYLKKCFRNKFSFSQFSEKQSPFVEIKKLSSLTFLPNWKLEYLHGEIDLFVNFISFQEMEPDIVKNYVRLISKLNPKYILLRNLREGKQKQTKTNLGVIKPILKNDYLRFFSTYTLLKSNVVPFGYKTVDGYHSELMILKRD